MFICVRGFDGMKVWMEMKWKCKYEWQMDANEDGGMQMKTKIE